MRPRLQPRVEELAGAGSEGRSRGLRRDRREGVRSLHSGHRSAPWPLRHSGRQRRHPASQADHRVRDRGLSSACSTPISRRSGRWREEAARVMIPRKAGRIIMTGSVSAILARPTISAYVASKGAVHALTRELAVELAPHNITVERDRAGLLRYRDEYRADREQGVQRLGVQAHAGRTLGQARGDRTSGGVPRLGRGVLREWSCA